MTQRFYITPEEIEKIRMVINENNIRHSLELIHTPGGGIGSSLDVEFSADIHGREAVIRIPITGVENW